MPDKPTQDEVLRQLECAYESGRLPEYAGEEFLAAAKAKATSVLLIRVGVVLGILALGAAGYFLYSAAMTPGDPKPAYIEDDPHGDPTVLRLRSREQGR